MKKQQPDLMAQHAFEEKEKKRIKEDKLYEEERIRNLNAMTEEQRLQRNSNRKENMLKIIRESKTVVNTQYL